MIIFFMYKGTSSLMKDVEVINVLFPKMREVLIMNQQFKILTFGASNVDFYLYFSGKFLSVISEILKGAVVDC